jgi:hypothetical protein
LKSDSVAWQRILKKSAINFKSLSKSASNLDIPKFFGPADQPESHCVGTFDHLEYQVSSFCEQHFVLFVSNPEGIGMSKHLQLTSNKTDTVIRIVFSKNPLSIALKTRWVQFLIAIIGVIVMCEVLVNSLIATQLSSIHGHYLHFTVDEGQSTPGNLQVIQATIKSLGLLQGSCSEPLSANNTTLDGATWTIELNQVVVNDGWYVLTNPGHSLSVPMNILPQSSDDGHLWSEVALPPWMCGFGSFPRDQLTSQDLRFPWE